MLNYTETDYERPNPHTAHITHMINDGDIEAKRTHIFQTHKPRKDAEPRCTNTEIVIQKKKNKKNYEENNNNNHATT